MVVKLNKAAAFPGMFEKEAQGLTLLRKANAFKVPKVYNHGIVDQFSYLLIEWIPEGNPGPTFWDEFAEHLAQLHRQTSGHFGLDTDNYIGSLPQYNKTSLKQPADFYIEKRLKPQFKLAKKNGFDFPDLDSFYANIKNLIPHEKPALIHGDLWAGNYITTDQGKPVLIDPAVAFAPREMDIAMMHLFGGFPPEVFKAYNRIFPMEKDWKKRIGLWQLYYLLVHLNLFGAGYLPDVKRALNQYQ